MRQLTYVRQKRKSWALRQVELARLLGIAESVLCRIERGLREPEFEVAVGLEIIFGEPISALFPGAFDIAEEAVMRRAVTLDRSIGGKNDESSRRKRELLSVMATRAGAKASPA